MAERCSKILVVDDEPKYLRTIKLILEGYGYLVCTARDGAQAVEAAARERPDVILLDVAMPGMDGYAACQAIRQFSHSPILLLTARAAEADKVRGLDAGADDYITKPFSTAELCARIRAALRRAGWHEPPTQPLEETHGALKIDPRERRAFLDGCEVHLTPVEYRLLVELARHPRRLLQQDYLLRTVWGGDAMGQTQLLWKTVHRLRHKLNSGAGQPEVIETRAGIGYIFHPPGLAHT